jgi:hypothetical protein
MWASYWSNRVLALKRAGVHVTTRPIRYRKETIIGETGKEEVITTPQEKGIDVRLALDVVSLARNRQFDVALIFSQDQDLQEVVQEVADISKEQQRWIGIACAFPSGPTLLRPEVSTRLIGSKWIKRFTINASIHATTGQKRKVAGFAGASGRFRPVPAAGVMA